MIENDAFQAAVNQSFSPESQVILPIFSVLRSIR